MPKSFNSAQAKLLANFSSDLAKGLLLAGVSAPFVSREFLAYKWILVSLYAIMATMLLKFALDVLKGVRND